MKHFSPSYWFKLWLLSAQLFSDQTKNTNAMLIDKNKNIKNWANKNSTSLDSVVTQSNFINSSIENITNNQFISNQARNIEQFNQTNLDIPRWDNNLTKIKNKKNKKRIKRQVNNQPRIFNVTITLYVVSDSPIHFFNRLLQIVRELNQNDFLRRMQNEDGSYTNTEFYYISPPTDYDYFRIPIQIRWEENEETQIRNLELFYRSSDFYLQGFILDNRYRYFSDSELINPNIANITPEELPFSGSYAGSNSLEHHNQYSWQTIFNDFQTLANPSSSNREIQRSAIGVILATAESARFATVREAIIRSEYENREIPTGQINPTTGQPITLDLAIRTTVEVRNWDYFYQIITNWNYETQRTIDYFRHNRGNLNDFSIYQWRENLPRIFIFSLSMYTIMQECHERVKRDTNDEVCYSKDIIPCTVTNYFVDKNQDLYNLDCNSSESLKINIDWKVKLIKILTKDSLTNSWVKKGTLFIGTNKGLYTINIINNEVSKRMSTVNEEITDIIIDENSIIMTKSEIGYFLKLKDWSYSKSNFESSDLNKEIKLYYNLKKENIIMEHDWYLIHNNNTVIKEFYLSKILPVNYKKIEFLGDNENFKLSRISWGDTDYWPKDKLSNFSGYNVVDIMKNYDVTPNIKDWIADINAIHLQPVKTEKYMSAWLEWSQSFGITFYWSKGDWFLQVLIRQYANSGGSLSRGTLFMGIGNGIRLYNDDDVEVVNENTNSWKNNEIINAINNEENEENITSTANIEASNNFDINDINYILNYQNQSLANVSTTNIPTI